MVEELARDRLPDVARAHDDGVLEVGRVPAAIATRARTPERDEHRGERPEGGDAPKLRVGETAEVRAGEEHPCPERDHVQDADQVVGRRVVGPLLVAVVETVELGEDDPAGKRREEEEVLGLECDSPRGPRAERKLRSQEGASEPEDVGGQQHPAHEPAAPPDEGGPPPAVDDLERSLVDRGRHLVVQDNALVECRTLRPGHLT
jgi:hypothetical protein